MRRWWRIRAGSIMNCGTRRHSIMWRRVREVNRDVGKPGAGDCLGLSFCKKMVYVISEMTWDV